MSGMPYHLEKGPFFSVAEAVLNSSKQERYAILEMLRSGGALTDLDGPAWLLESTSLTSKYTPTTKDIVHHGNDFLGGTYKGTTFVKKKGSGDGVVGFRNYEGDIEGIVRTTFIRALEVSLGLSRDERIEDQAPADARFWPIEFTWKCPIAWVEGWVTWERHADGSGHVVVHLLTPSHNHPILTRPEDGRNAVREPKDCGVANGMWVITHRHNKATFTKRIDTSEFGEWVFPTWGPVYAGKGPVVTVAPSEGDGGVRPWGRDYVRPGLPSGVVGTAGKLTKKSAKTNTAKKNAAKKTRAKA